jgi:HEAT repeat protein
MLDAKDAGLRENAAVSLEFVGSAKAVDPLLKRLGKEKDEVQRTHLLRALGRCGVGNAAARKALLKDVLSKSDVVAAGALLGLGYMSGDAEAARALEKGLHGSEDGLRRTATVWALVEIGDAKSLPVLKALLAETAEVLPSHRLLESAVAALSGDTERRAEVDSSLRWMFKEKAPRADAARGRRGNVGFTPKGDAPSQAE